MLIISKLKTYFLFFIVLTVFSRIGFGQTVDQKEIPRDTSYTPYQTWIKIKKEFPQAEIVKPHLPEGVKAEYDIVYVTIAETSFGKRDLYLDVFRPAKDGK